MYYVYVLYSRKTNKLYKGSCNNIKKRVSQHGSGQVRSTKDVQDWQLVYYQAFVSKTDCLREERFLKTGRGRERLRLLLNETLK